MDFNATIDLIIKDLAEAREIIDDLKKYPGVPALQVELAKSKCKSAGEVIALLKSMQDIKLIQSEEPVTASQQQNLPEEKKPPVKPVKINQPTEDKKKEKTVSEIHSPSVEKKEGLKKTQNKETGSEIIADKFSHLANRFNEQLGTLKNDDDMSDILKAKPVTSLTEAMGVNDKFLFIREIFDGNKDAYSQAILRLENIESLADARAIIMSYTGDNNESEAVKQLLDLVKRKLPSDE